MNNFQHLINFQNALSIKSNENYDQLTAQRGDFWRWLAPKYIGAGLEPERLSLALQSVKTGDLFPAGTIRKQQSENYVDFSLWVGSVPVENEYRQFALERANGQRVIGTFTGQQSNKADYMAALKDFYESYPYTKVFCDVDGSKMRVRIWEKDGVFKLQDETLIVGLGERSESNTNRPRIERINQGNVIYPAMDSYTVTVGSDIQVGNVFELGNQSYEASTGDTPEVVLAALGVSGRYQVNAGTAVEFGAQSGSRTIQNTNRLTVRAIFVETVGGNDRYVIDISGSLQVGNIIQVSATGRNTISTEVAQNSTVNSVQNSFYVGGYYTVSAGVVPSVSFVSGVQQIENTNNPSLNLNDLEQKPSYTVTRWNLVVGADVVAGNVFKLGDLEYMAKSGDTALTIANAFGYDSVSMRVETELGTKPNAYALQGFKYDETNIADITLAESPKLRISSQLVVEMTIGENIANGYYRLAVVDQDNVIRSLGNYLKVKDKAEGELVEVADSGDVFGYEYYETGLTQRMRFPMIVSSPVQKTTEEKLSQFNGGYRRTTTQIESVSKVVTRAGRTPFHETLASFMKHESVWIGGKNYYCEGAYSETVLSEGTDIKQASFEIIELAKERNNFKKYRSSLFQSGSNGGFSQVSFAGIFDLWLNGSNIVGKITNGANTLPTGSYQVSGESTDNVQLKFYENGLLRLEVRIPAKERFRLTIPIKFESGSFWTIWAQPSADGQPEITYKCETLSQLDVEYTCQVSTKPIYGQFSNDFGQDFNS